MSGAASMPGQDLGGKQWQWVKTNLNNGQTFNPTNPADYTIEFSMIDGHVIIKADCNNATGDFMTDGQSLQIMIGGVTRAMCPPPSDEYVKLLDQVASYKIEGSTLFLALKTDGGIMTFTTGGAQRSEPRPRLSLLRHALGVALELEVHHQDGGCEGLLVLIDHGVVPGCTFQFSEGAFEFVACLLNV